MCLCVPVCASSIVKFHFHFGDLIYFGDSQNISSHSVLMPPLSVVFVLIILCMLFTSCHNLQFIVYLFSTIFPGGGGWEKKHTHTHREWVLSVNAWFTHTHTQHILSDLWQNIHSVDIFITLWTIKKEEESAAAVARDNLWPKLISSVTESRFVYVCAAAYVAIVHIFEMTVWQINDGNTIDADKRIHSRTHIGTVIHSNSAFHIHHTYSHIYRYDLS